MLVYSRKILGYLIAGVILLLVGIVFVIPVDRIFQKNQFPEIVFLSPASAPMLWGTELSGREPQILTNMEGGINDYSVVPGGKEIVYSKNNVDGGSNLWILGKNQRERLILDCGKDICIQPVMRENEEQIAYSRKISDDKSSDQFFRIWILDLKTKKSNMLFEDLKISGENPTWSPEGEWLVFYDSKSGRIIVLDWERKRLSTFVTSSNTGVTWVAEDRFLFIDYIQTVMQPFVNVYSVDVNSGNINRLFEDNLYQLEIGLPVPTKDGNWYAIAMRVVDGSPSKQIYLTTPTGSEFIPVTIDQRYTHSAYHWSGDDNLLIYQRLQMGISDAKPEVVIWSRDTKQSQIIATDATNPNWMNQSN